MTINSILILNYLKQHFGQELSKQDIATGAGVTVAAVGLSMKSHVENGRATMRVEEYEETNEKGKTTVKKKYFYTLTEDGLAFDPEVYEAEKKAEAAAKRKTKREAEKAAKEAAAE